MQGLLHWLGCSWYVFAVALLPWEARGLLLCGAPPVPSSGSSLVSGFALGSLVHFECL